MQRTSDTSKVCDEVRNRVGKVRKLIVTDLDGTLLDNHSELRSEYAKEIRRLLQDGVKLTIASGRAFNSIRPFAEKLDVNMPVICELGAFIIDPITEKKIFEKTIPHEVVSKTLNFLKKSKYLFNVYLSRGNEYKCFKSLDAPFFLDRKPVAKMDDDLMNIFNTIFRNIDDYDGGTIEGIRKISIRCYESQLDDLKSKISEILSDEATVKQSDTNCLDISPPGVSKGTGLSYILNLCGISPDDVMAIGDNETDTTMFKVAKHSVAVANGDDSTKQAAKFVTLSNEENGVLYAIKKFLEE
jgi:Cof subfamily protein (haloacid dehalogenase superfamily)